MNRFHSFVLTALGGLLAPLIAAADVPRAIVTDAVSSAFNVNFPSYFCHDWQEQNVFEQQRDGLSVFYLEGVASCVVGAGDIAIHSFAQPLTLEFVEKGNRFDLSLIRDGNRLRIVVSVSEQTVTPWQATQENLRLASALAARRMMTEQNRSVEAAARSFADLNHLEVYAAQLIRAANSNPAIRPFAYDYYQQNKRPDLELAMTRYVEDLIKAGDSVNGELRSVMGALPQGKAYPYFPQILNTVGWGTSDTIWAVRTMAERHPQEFLRLAVDTVGTASPDVARLCDRAYSAGIYRALADRNQRDVTATLADSDREVFETAYRHLVSAYMTDTSVGGCYNDLRDVLAIAGSPYAEPNIWTARGNHLWSRVMLDRMHNAVRLRTNSIERIPLLLPEKQDALLADLNSLKSRIPSSFSSRSDAGLEILSTELVAADRLNMVFRFGYADTDVSVSLVWATRKLLTKDLFKTVEKDVSSWFLDAVSVGGTAAVETAAAPTAPTTTAGTCRVADFEVGVKDEEPCTKAIRSCSAGTNDCVLDFTWPSGAITVVESVNQFIAGATKINGSDAGLTNRMGEGGDDCALNFTSGNMFCFVETAAVATTEAAPTAAFVAEVPNWAELAPGTLVCPRVTTAVFYKGGLFESREVSGESGIEFLRVENTGTGAGIEPIDSLLFFQTDEWQLCDPSEVQAYQAKLEASGYGLD